MPICLNVDVLIPMVAQYQPHFMFRTNGRTIRKSKICIQMDMKLLHTQYRKLRNLLEIKTN
jgi:hypothetical protein